MANNTTDENLSLIPKEHLASVVSNARMGNMRGHQDKTLLMQLQKQLNYLMGIETEQRNDVVMVNPHGRIVEIAGEYVDEWIQKPGFRQATAEEEQNYRKAIIRQTPEYLRRKEQKRLQEQNRLLDEVEAEDAKGGSQDLLRTKVTDAQKTGAMTPEEVKELNLRKQEAEHGESNTSADEAEEKTPPKRGSRRTGPTSEDIENA